MKDKDFENLLKFQVKYDALIPLNDNANDYVLLNNRNEVYVKDLSPRDMAFHGVYFAWCGWCWEQMPPKFKEYKCPERKNFYKFLKVIDGKCSFILNYQNQNYYEMLSISFSKMKEAEFKEFVNYQITNFYNKILIPLKMQYLYDIMVAEFHALFNRLI